MKNERVLERVEEDMNILHTIKWRKANWIGHISRRNCFLKHVIEGKMEVTGRGGRRREQLPDDLKGSATQKAGCRGGQTVAGNRGGLQSGDARHDAAAKSGPVWKKAI
jgi:hypothetical protein